MIGLVVTCRAHKFGAPVLGFDGYDLSEENVM